MRKQTNFFDSIITKVVVLILAIIVINSVEFTITVSKKRNSVIQTMVDFVDSGYTGYQTIKKAVR